jgi:hypothetical protein
MTRAVNVYERLGDTPPRIDIHANDLAYEDAHTLDRHGPQIPLRRDDAPDAEKTLDERLKDDSPWNNTQNFSFRWIDEPTMHRVVNDFLRNNWAEIRPELALHGSYKKTFDHGHVVGEGFYNANIGLNVDPHPVYWRTSFVTIYLRATRGRGPPEFRIVTAYPNGRGH